MDVPTQGYEERVDQRLPDVSFLDAGSQEQLAVRFKIPAQLGDVVFPLIERFPHTRISFAPHYFQSPQISTNRVEKSNVMYEFSM
jgi:hypothetical protein